MTCHCLEDRMSKLDRDESLGGVQPSAAQISAERLAAEAKLRAEAEARAANYRTGGTSAAAQKEPLPPSVPSLDDPTLAPGSISTMSDIDLARLAAEAERLPVANTNSSEDFQRLADGRSARAEIFKRALRKPVTVRPGAG
jgi:hypothetical protein